MNPLEIQKRLADLDAERNMIFTRISEPLARINFIDGQLVLLRELAAPPTPPTPPEPPAPPAPLEPSIAPAATAIIDQAAG